MSHQPKTYVIYAGVKKLRLLVLCKSEAEAIKLNKTIFKGKKKIMETSEFYTRKGLLLK